VNTDIAVRDSDIALTRPIAPGYMDPATAAGYLVASGVMGKVPEAQIVVRIMIGAELGVGPVTSARLIHTFEAQGRMVIELDATLMTALVKHSRRYWFQEARNDAGGVVLNWFEEGIGKVGTSSFGPDDAKRAQLGGKDNYVKYGRDMYFARALSRGVDHYCADLLCGLPVASKDDIDRMPMGHDQRKAIFAGLKGYDMDDDERHDWASDIVGRRVDSFAEGHPSCPTRPEAGLLIEWLADQAATPTTIARTETAGGEPREEEGDGGTDEAAGAGATTLGEVRTPPAPVPLIDALRASIDATKAAEAKALTVEPLTGPPPDDPEPLEALIREWTAAYESGRRSKKALDGWKISWLENEKLPGWEFATPEQAQRGLDWFRAQFPTGRR
jgi:hypothetical protein